jgi:hypothetical protein
MATCVRFVRNPHRYCIRKDCENEAMEGSAFCEDHKRQRANLQGM